MKEWVDKLGSGTMTAGAAPVAPRQDRRESQTARITRLESENAALKVEQAKLAKERVKLAKERDILRQAAKYFAGETNW